MLTKIKIEICGKKDIQNLKKFIHNHWKKNHILSKNNQVMQWFYGNKNLINFVLAKNNNKIIGVLGFIPNFKFDQSLKKDSLIWLALWKVINKNRFSGVGIKLLNFLQKKFKKSKFACNGINDRVELIYELLNFSTFTLNHYYLINDSLKQKILKKNNKIFKFVRKKDFYRIEKLNQKIIKTLKFSKKNLNNKSKIYILNRYLKCPFFDYSAYGVYKKNLLVAVFISKIQLIKRSKILRIIDFIGDPKHLKFLKNSFKMLLHENKIEYLDFYNYGISELNFKDNGFYKNNFNNKFVVPNYFQPFVNKNIRIKSAFLSDKKKLNIFKGDGDQDIPH